MILINYVVLPGRQAVSSRHHCCVPCKHALHVLDCNICTVNTAVNYLKVFSAFFIPIASGNSKSNPQAECLLAPGEANHCLGGMGFKERLVPSIVSQDVVMKISPHVRQYFFLRLDVRQYFFLRLVSRLFFFITSFFLGWDIFSSDF